MGMIAMKTIMQMDRNRGYSLVDNIFPVISSWTISPNIIQPIIAIEQSRENWHEVRMNENVRSLYLTVKMYVDQRLFPYFCGCLISR